MKRDDPGATDVHGVSRVDAGTSRAQAGARRVPARSRARQVLASGTAVMLAGTVMATVGAYAFQLLGGRALGARDFAPITVLWSVQFLVMTVVMLPVEQLIIRRLELSRGRSAGLGDSVLPLAALLIGTVVCAATAMAVLGQGLTEGSGGYAVMAGLLVAGYSVFAAARGHLAGRHRYRDYGIATAVEALGRLLLAAAVLLVVRDGMGLAVVMALAPLCVLVTRPFARAGSAGQAEAAVVDDEPSADVVVGKAGRFLGSLVLANGVAQAMLGVGPLVVAAVGASAQLVSAVFVTFTLFRGPLWIIQSVLARVLPPFTALARSGQRATLEGWAVRLAGLGVVLAGIGGPLGWWVGPDIVGLLFGRQFTPSASLAALVAAGTALAAMTAISSQILIAVGSTWEVALAWAFALVVAASVFLLGGAPDVRVGLAFLAGELTALVLVTTFAAVPRTGRSVRRQRGAVTASAGTGTGTETA